MPGVLATSVPLAVVLFVQLIGVAPREEFIPCEPVAAPLVEPAPDDPALLVLLAPLLLVPLLLAPLLPVPPAPLMVLSLFIGVELHAASVNAITPPATRLEIAVFMIAPLSLICAHDLSIYSMHL
jgi:uncharacterized membrane protein AbrB (regulator of aidB expression)